MNARDSRTNLNRKSAIFVHIQKTAGTSMIDLIKQHYQQKHVISHGNYLEGVDPARFQDNSWLDEKAIDSFRNVPFLSGHFGYDFAKLFMSERYSFTFLRDPVERVLSFYYFCRNRDPNEYKIYRLCQQLSLDEFLKKGLEHSEVNAHIWNNQVWQLACGFGDPENRGLSSFVPEELLDRAIKHLDHFSYIGFTETFEEDRDNIFRDLDICPPKEKFASNANRGRPTSKDLPGPTLELLKQLTQLDQVIYQRAWAQRLKLIKSPRFMANLSQIPQQVNHEQRHIYEYSVDLTGETAPVHVIHMVGASKRVLEIGCGRGSVTKILAQHGGCRVTGLELDLDAIKKAAPYCETIMQADLNSAEWPRLLDDVEQFDVVVAADVLEHLYDPWITLQRLISCIGPNGYLVISLPHIGHAAVVSCVINSDFEYHDRGLLDRTHIRFFGIKNIEELFAQADLKIIEVKYVLKSPEETEFSASWSALSATVQDAIKSSAYADVYQVVVKAVPVGYPGEAVPLAPPEPEPPRMAVSNRVPWRRRIGQYLSPQHKQRIRKGFKLMGIDL